jgi:peptidyl-lysine (3S)-dioxygenase / protease
MGNFVLSIHANGSLADSIIDGYFVEPHLQSMPFSEMLDWLLSRRNSKRQGSVRYIQSQNNNLLGDFQMLQRDVRELAWATECFGTSICLIIFLTSDAPPDASNIWIGNEESITSLHLGKSHVYYTQYRSL